MLYGPEVKRMRYKRDDWLDYMPQQQRTHREYPTPTVFLGIFLQTKPRQKGTRSIHKKVDPRTIAKASPEHFSPVLYNTQNTIILLKYLLKTTCKLLERIQIDALSPDKCSCSICDHNYQITPFNETDRLSSLSTSATEEPVRLLYGHIFGEVCICQWVFPAPHGQDRNFCPHAVGRYSKWMRARRISLIRPHVYLVQFF